MEDSSNSEPQRQPSHKTIKCDEKLILKAHMRNVIKTAKGRIATLTKVTPNIEGPNANKGLTSIQRITLIRVARAYEAN